MRFSLNLEFGKNRKSSFDWGKDQSEATNVTRQEARRPTPRDWTDGLTINRTLTKALYHNSYPGMKLSGGLAYPPVALPVWFMGLPVPVIDDDERAQERIDLLVREMGQQMQHIHTQCHREGTVWVWPHYSSRDRRLRWEFIPDDTVTDIIRNLNTGEIIRIITDEDIEVAVNYNQTTFVRRTRVFEKNRVIVKYGATGRGYGSNLPGELVDRTMRNPAGVIPIPFSNNRDGDEIRGHSDYERIVTDLKDYHDIDLRQSRMLAKFEPKLIQYGSESPDTWLANNGWDSIADINVDEIDLIYNYKDREDTSFVWPQGAHEAYDAGLKRKFRKIVEASGIPEIAWGLKTEGNHASAEEQMGILVQYVQGKQDQATPAYEELFRSSLVLLSLAGEIGRVPEVTVEWNNLDALSEETKAKIFNSFAQGIARLIDSAGVTKDQIHKLWLRMYPEATDDEFRTFVEGISDMAGHKQFKEANYLEALDTVGRDPNEDMNGGAAGGQE